MRPGLLHGLALGVARGVDEVEEPIDTLTRPTSWFPVFVPLFAEGAPVRPGDRVLLDFAWSTSDDGVHPDYRVHAVLLRSGSAPAEMVWESPHHATAPSAPTRSTPVSSRCRTTSPERRACRDRCKSRAGPWLPSAPLPL